MVLRDDPPGIRRLAAAADRAALDASAVLRHIKFEAEMREGFVGIMHPMATLHYDCYEGGQTAAQRLFDRCYRLSTEIDAAAKMYEHTDDAAARQLDATYTPVDIPPHLRTSRSSPPLGFTGPVAARPASTFADVIEPQTLLRQPMAGDRPDFQWKFDMIAGWLSPSSMVRGLVLELFGFDPFEWFLARISGNWQGLWECGVTWSQASAATAAVSRNIRTAAHDLPTAWEGNAADACQMYLYQLSAAVSQLSGYYDAFADKYLEAARIAWTGFELLGSLAHTLLDTVIQIAVVIGADALSLGSLSQVAVAAVGLLVWNAMRLFRDFLSEYDKLVGTLEVLRKGLTAIVASFKAVVSDQPPTQGTPLPDPYDHPGV